MQIVNQLTSFTCGLACIESLSADFNAPITQCEMLIKYKERLIKDVPDFGDFGAARPALLEFIWQDLGFTGSWQKNNHDKTNVKESVFKTLKVNQSILIFCNFNKNSWHCIRFSCLKNDDTISAMIPLFLEPSRIDDVSLQNLIDWEFYYAIISN